MTVNIKGINFAGQYFGCLGIPNHTRDFASALVDNLERVNLSPIHPNHNNDQYGLTDKLNSNFRNVDSSLPSLMFWYPDSYKDFFSKVPDCPKKIGYYIFEYTTIPKVYVDEINKLDAVCTASQWGVDILKKNGVTIPTHVIPGGVNHEVFNSNGRNLDTKRFRFLHMGKAENRKGTEIIIRAFNKAFEGNRKIRLSLFIDNPHLHQFNGDTFLHNVSESYGLKHPVTNIDIRNFQQDLDNIYKTHHVAVFGSKAEGIGLPIVEAMSSGLPTIVPFNSGITEYATKDNSIRLMDLVEEPVFDPKFFATSGEFGVWNAPTVDEMADKMVWAYENWEEAEAIGKRAEEYMKSQYSWDISAKKFIKELL